ncbi:hypothetical protein C8R44DRAFT_883622 [Mycena epipterygia]|nr:hypothetical protein C8R44DRAFT_883622 [Mycena epipterygia]
MHPSPANHPCLVCGRATSQCQTAWYCSAEQPTVNTDDIPAEGSTLPAQLRHPRACFVPGARTVCAADPSLTVDINSPGDSESINGATGGSSNAAEINGGAPMPFDRNQPGITIHGGQGGNGGEGGGTGGTGGAGEGNPVQIHFAGGGTIFNVHCHGGRDGDLDFVWDMVMCLAWLALSTLALACLHHHVAALVEII